MTNKYIYIIDENSSIEFENKQYTLKSGYPVKNDNGSYSDEDYTQAMANGLIIATEIKKASDQGYKEVLIQKGDYFVCAKWEDYYYPKGSIQIENVHDININFNNSSIKLIYDSNNRNKYCTIAAPNDKPYNQRAWVIVLYKSTNIEIKNLNLIGDAIDRSWTNNDENKMEHTYGIVIGQICKDIKLSNITGRYFMGDVITGMFGAAPYATILIDKWNVDKGIDDNGVLVDVAATEDIHSLVSDLFEFDSDYQCPYYAIQFSGTYREFIKKYSIKGMENFIQFSVAPGTYTYQKDGYAWKFALYKKDKSTETYSLSRIGIGDIFSIIDISNYDAIRLIIDKDVIDFGEDDISTGIWNHNFYIGFGQLHTTNIEVDNCYIADCHRGGISNMPYNTTIKNTIFQNCGMDCNIDAPLFPDSTRYCINQEEQYIDKMIIDKCKFDNAFNGCLFNVKDLIIRNCDFVNVNNVFVNTTTQALIENNTFIGGNVNSNTNIIGWRGGQNMKSLVMVCNNTIYTKKLNLYNIVRRKIIYKNNNIFTENITIYNNEDLTFENCNILLTNKTGWWSSNKIIDVNLNNVTIESLHIKQSIFANNLKGKFYVKNTIIYANTENKDFTLFDGLHLDSTSEIKGPGDIKTVPYNTIYKNSIFEGKVLIFPNNDKSNAYLIIENCEFKYVDKPLYVESWQNISNKNFNVVILNSVFEGNKDNVFSKRITGNIDLNVTFGNCYFKNNIINNE